MTSTSHPKMRERLERRLEELPVLPKVAVELMGLSETDEHYFERLIGIVESEPSYTARILALANSAASGSREPIVTLRAALSRIGSRGVSNLVTALSVAHVFVPRDAAQKSLWRHALATAIAARELALRAGEVPASEAYTCGLLHDIGRFVMIEETPEDLLRIPEGDAGDPAGLLATERSVCGVAHTDLGALACGRWNLPESIVEVVRTHHDPPGPAPGDRVSRLVALVRFADVGLFPSSPDAPEVAEADDAYLHERVLPFQPPSLHLEPAELRTLHQLIARQAAASAEVLGIG